MKKYLAIILLFCFAATINAQKIPQAKLEAMFKTPQYWQNVQVNRLKIAPTAAVLKITQFNAAALAKGYTFRIAYTSKFGVPLAQLTGGRNPDPASPKYRPDRSYSSLPFRLNLLHIDATISTPAVDMRQFGIITPVRDQNPCGSCWVFGSVAALETNWLMKNGGDVSTLNLSEQQVLNCTGGNNSCNGGWNNESANYMCTHRIAAEGMYGYTAMDSICGSGNSVASPYKGRRWDWVGSSVNELKQAIIDHGSVSTTIWFSDELHNYGGGVYNLENAPPFGQCNHVVQIVGWDDGKQAWLIKNSWGEGWGEGGFAWIKYGVNYVGTHSIWMEAELTGDLPVVVNNPYQPPSTGILFTSSDYNTLRGLYAKASIFRIASRQNQKVLDVDDPVFGSGDKGHKMQQWSNHGQVFAGSDGHNQEWFFIEAGRRGEKPVYKIFNYGFNDFLQANESSPRCENGNAADNQLWYIMPQSNKSEIKIKSVANGKFVQVPSGNNNDGGLIELAAESTASNQLFDLNINFYNPNIELAVFRLMPKHHDGSALDLSAGNLNNGTGLQIWQKTDNNVNQQWRFTFNGGTGYFRLHPKMNDNKSMEVAGFSMDNGGRVTIYDHTDGANQDWLFIRIARENDKFIIFNRQSGKCLDVYGVGTADGTIMQQWEFVNGDNQKWKLEKL